jgi:hypothetical protein
MDVGAPHVVYYVKAPPKKMQTSTKSMSKIVVE